MTLVSTLSSLRRFWVVTALGLTLALGCGVLVRETPPTHYARVAVYFSPAQTNAYPNSLARRQGGIVEFLGVVQRRLTQQLATPRLASPRVMLVDEGVTHGVRVVLPNAGGQWDESYPSPMLDVQVVGSTAEEVRTRTTATLRAIEDTARELQAERGVDAKSLLISNLSPPPDVEVHEARGPTARAGVVLAIVVLGVTVALAEALDRRFPLR